jgi:hypothetical protein
MSHFATTWAIQQRGLEAAAKVLLFCIWRIATAPRRAAFQRQPEPVRPWGRTPIGGQNSKPLTITLES